MSGGTSATTVMAAASLAATAGGMAMSIIGQQRQADAQEKAAAYQAQLADNKQIQDQQQAQAALDQAAAQEQQQRYKTAAALGSQRAQLAANGVDLGSGSALDVQSDTASLGELNALSIGTNGQNQYNNLMYQADGVASQAALSNYNSQMAQQAAEMKTDQGLMGNGLSLINQVQNFPF